MRKVEIILFLLVFPPAPLLAESFYGLSKVRFFDEEQKDTQPALAGKEPEVSLWAEPRIGPDGKISVYMPPLTVTDFLNNPTEKNAKAYLEWNTKRLTKIAAASEVLAKVAGTAAIVTPVTSPVTVPTKKSTTPVPLTAQQPTIWYFAKSKCKYCKAEDLIVDIFNKRYGHKIAISGYWVGAGSSPSLSFPFQPSAGLETKLRIATYPAFIFFIPGLSSPAKLEGFATGEQLVNFYQKLGGKL